MEEEKYSQGERMYCGGNRNQWYAESVEEEKYSQGEQRCCCGNRKQCSLIVSRKKSIPKERKKVVVGIMHNKNKEYGEGEENSRGSENE